MSKKRYTPKEAESSLDDVFEASIEVAQKKFPHNVYTGGEESMRCICLPVPALAPRVLLQQEGFPLGRFYLLDGPKESFKSSLGYEFIRWHRRLGGKGQIIEVEDKKSPDMCLSINNWDHKAFATHFCDTMQDWNAGLTYWIHEFIKIMDGDPKAPKSRPGIGRNFPISFLVDSIMAAVGEGIMADIEKEGHGKTHFATDTGLLSDFLKAFTKWIPEYPFSVVGVNHLKPTQNKQGFTIRHMPGGKAPEYHATIDIEVNKVKEDRLASGKQYARLRLRTQKNSMAPKNEILVDIFWYIDIDHPTEDGECLQRTFFDWDAASIGCIFSTMENSGVELKKRIKELTGLRIVNDTKKTVACDVIGVTSNDPLSFHDAGVLLETKIQEDKAFRDLLYPLLGIRRRHLFRPKMDYRDQMNDARDDALRAQAMREAVINAAPLDTQDLDSATEGSGAMEIE